MQRHEITISEMRGGVLRWGYRHAADVVTWSYAHGVLSAELANMHALNVKQTPLVFVASNAGTGRPDYRRELIGVVVDGSRLTARLAPKRTE